MFDAHPPFQIDGNFGFTTGVAETLMQNCHGDIHWETALHDEWKNGSYSGLRERGGFRIVSMDWKDGKIVRLIVKSNLGGNAACVYTMPKIFMGNQE